jgi:hypothetical protein
MARDAHARTVVLPINQPRRQTMLTRTKTAVAVVAVAAIAAPSAGARPADSAKPAAPAAPPRAMTRTVEVPSTGFDWTDAGLGAAGMLSLLTLGAGGVAVTRRGRRGHPTLS